MYKSYQLFCIVSFNNVHINDSKETQYLWFDPNVLSGIVLFLNKLFVISLKGTWRTHNQRKNDCC